LIKYVWTKFKEMFPDLAEGISSYKQEGKHGISMQAADGSSIIFTYDGPKDYTLTVSRKRRTK